MLNVTELCGFGAGGAVTPGLTKLNSWDYDAFTAGSSVTISGTSLGSATHVLVVAIGSAASGNTTTGITVDGSAASKVVESGPISAWMVKRSASTGDIVLSYSASWATGVVTYALDCNAESADSTQTGTGSETITIGIVKGGCALVATTDNGASFTETDAEFSGFTRVMTTGSYSGSTSILNGESTGDGATATFTGGASGNLNYLLAASWS